MPNGKMTTRDYVIETHTALKALKENFSEHKKNHKWLIGLLFVIPPALYYLMKIVEG